MYFNSLQFIVFFLVVVYLYFLVPFKFRWILLLVASYYFYMCWKAEYIILIVISTLIDYFAGIKMGQCEDQSKKKKYLILSLISNFGILFLFKYFNLFNSSIRVVLSNFNLFYNVSSFKMLLPVGISFYTFQTLSYTIDVYRGEREPEKHLGIFALYVSFFPQLVAGPIERSTTLMPQFSVEHFFDWQRVKDGLRLMLWGFFKKIVIADNLAIFVDAVYGNPTSFHGGTLLIATYLFAFQIYYDFCGYSEIAIGASRVMGYELMTNFKQPYFASSISDFWQRWHISLSTWFKDYVYIPLGGNRVSRLRWFTNIMIVFVSSGLWHGANWTFVIWGALHGFYYWIELLLKSFKSRLSLLSLNMHPIINKSISVFITFNFVCLAWIFFRAASFSDAILIMKLVLTNIYNFEGLNKVMLHPKVFLLIYGTLIIFTEFGAIFEQNLSFSHQSVNKRMPIWLRWKIYYAVIFIILTLGNFQSGKQFIYFQF